MSNGIPDKLSNTLMKNACNFAVFATVQAAEQVNNRDETQPASQPPG